MKLEPTQKDKTLYEFYNALDWPLPWRVRIERMLALVTYLETEIDYPLMLATHSHEDLVLCNPNRSRLIRIMPTVSLGVPKDTVYEAHCALDAPWFHAVAYASSLEDVGRIVRAVINGEVQISLSPQGK